MRDPLAILLTGTRCAIASGSLMLLATAGCANSTGAAPTTPTSSASTGPTAITSCIDVTSPGKYVLAIDLPTCDLVIRAANVDVDCNRRQLSSLKFQGANTNATGCILTPRPGQGVAFDVDGATGGSLKNSDINGGYLDWYQASQFVFDGNRISGDCSLSVASSNHVSVTNNTITATAKSTTGGARAALIELASGSSNLVANNALDGGYHGSDKAGQGADDPLGTDDGIVVMNESGDIIQGNTINNVFDAAIEGAQSVSGTQIINNSTTNALIAGISSYHCTRWEGNTVSGNTVSQSLYLIYFLNDNNYLTCISASAFSNNQFANNVLRSPQTPLPGSKSFGMLVNFVSVQAPIAPSDVTANLIQANNFGSTLVSVFPTSGFTNGGGNVCGSGGNMICAGTGFTNVTITADHSSLPAPGRGAPSPSPGRHRR